VRFQNSWSFYKAKCGSTHSIKEVESGKIFEFSNLHTNQIILASEVITKGLHTWIIRIEHIKKTEDGKEEEKKEEEIEPEQNNNNHQLFGQPLFGQFGAGAVNFNNEF
jgi:hypothetical protein